MNKTFFFLWLFLALVGTSQSVDAELSTYKGPLPVTLIDTIFFMNDPPEIVALSDTAVIASGFVGYSHFCQALINGPPTKPSSYVLVVAYLGDGKKEPWEILPKIEEIVTATFGRPYYVDRYRVSDVKRLVVNEFGSLCIRGPSGSLLISRKRNVITLAFGRNPKVDFGAIVPLGCLSEKEFIVPESSLPTKLRRPTLNPE